MKIKSLRRHLMELSGGEMIAPKKKGDDVMYWLDRIEADLDAARANLQQEEVEVARYHLELLEKATERAMNALDLL